MCKAELTVRREPDRRTLVMTVRVAGNEEELAAVDHSIRRSVPPGPGAEIRRDFSRGQQRIEQTSTDFGAIGETRRRSQLDRIASERDELRDSLAECMRDLSDARAVSESRRQSLNEITEQRDKALSEVVEMRAENNEGDVREMLSRQDVLAEDDATLGSVVADAIRSGRRIVDMQMESFVRRNKTTGSRWRVSHVDPAPLRDGLAWQHQSHVDAGIPLDCNARPTAEQVKASFATFCEHVLQTPLSETAKMLHEFFRTHQGIRVPLTGDDRGLTASECREVGLVWDDPCDEECHCEYEDGMCTCPKVWSIPFPNECEDCESRRLEDKSRRAVRLARKTKAEEAYQREFARANVLQRKLYEIHHPPMVNDDDGPPISKTEHIAMLIDDRDGVKLLLEDLRAQYRDLNVQNDKQRAQINDLSARRLPVGIRTRDIAKMMRANVDLAERLRDIRGALGMSPWPSWSPTYERLVAILDRKFT